MCTDMPLLLALLLSPSPQWCGAAEGDVRGRHVVIVDDLVQSGGTLIHCANAMRLAGAMAVSCYVTHAVFPNDSWRKCVEGKLPKGDACSLSRVDVTPAHVPGVLLQATWPWRWESYLRWGRL